MLSRQFLSLSRTPMTRYFSTAEYAPVKKSRGLIIGWLGLYTAGMYFGITIGAYVRLSRGDKSLKKWNSKKYSLLHPPRNEQEWEEVRQDYINSTEGRLSNPGIQMKQLKAIFFIKVGNVIPALFMLPLFYPPMLFFLARGYFGKQLRRIMYVSLGVSAGNIALALNLNNSVNRNEYSDDYKISVNHVESFAPHLLGNATLFGIGVWALLTASRGHPNLGYTSIQQAIAAAGYRRSVHNTALFLFITLFTGYIIGVNGGGLASRTFPKLQQGYFPRMDKDYSVGLNFYYNKALTHFNHRTLALFFISASLLLGIRGLRAPLPQFAQLGAGLIIATVLLQFYTGMTHVNKSVPWENGSRHAGTALLIMAAFLITMHGLRRPTTPHLQQLLRQYSKEHGEEGARKLIESSPIFMKRNKWLKDFKY